MIKYVLFSKKAILHYGTEDRSEIVHRLGRLKSEGYSLDDYFVTIVDTENYPPKTLTADTDSFLKESRVPSFNNAVSG
jgi:hypothetical protein